MNSVETMISKKLKEAETTLDTLGADNKMLKLAVQDFANYFKHQFNLLGTAQSNIEVALKIDQLIQEDKAEFESFVTIWTAMWLKKWKQRVKLIIGNQIQEQKENKNIIQTVANVEPLWLKLEGKQEITEIIMASLIKNAEICGTEMLAQYLLKNALPKKTDQDINSIEQKLTILNNALSKARELAQNANPLIFVKVDKGYYIAATAKATSIQ